MDELIWIGNTLYPRWMVYLAVFGLIVAGVTVAIAIGRALSWN